MKNFLVLCLCVFSLISCISENEPEALLSADKMVEVLVDIHITETLVQQMPFSNDSLNVLYKLFEKDIFLKHEVSDSLFTQSMIYYLRDAAEMEQIYSRVYDSLEVRKSSKEITNQF